MPSKIAVVFALIVTGCSAVHNDQSVHFRHVARANATQLSPQSYLRKLSMHIRGMTPTRAEYDDLAKALTARNSDQFFKDKIAEYLASDQHVDKMTFRLEELFFLRPSGVPFNSDLQNVTNNNPVKPVPLASHYEIYNSMNQLFRDVTTRNLSWDTLLTAHSYQEFPLLAAEANPDLMSDALFFSALNSSQAQPTAPVKIGLDDDDARVSGVLTTSRFFNRYVNTALNKNRRRAAAVFRIFLCDDMKAVVIDEKGNQGEILDKVFPGVPSGPPKPLPDRHGTDAACMKCHYKLDPMGLNFQMSGLVLSPFASPGALVYTRADGSSVNIPGRGVGDVGRAIVKQSEYARCQVQHFWDWFVGQDQTISEPVMNELTEKFNEVQHRGNDFIAYLVQRPEFSGSLANDKTSQEMAGAKAVLQNCNGCHAVNNIPSFTDWPIGGTAQTHDHWLGRIQTALGFAGGARKMPPRSSAWQPDSAQMAALRAWFADGAPSDILGAANAN